MVDLSGLNKLLKNSYFVTLITFSLITLGGIARYSNIEQITGDLTDWLFPWYDYITSHGILNALGDKFSNYAPAYTYLLAVATTFPVQKIIAIKSISILMDIINCVLIYKIVKLRYQSGPVPLLSSAIFWILPTVIINSSYWGQCDSIYTGFLLLTLYMMILKRPLASLVYFSIALAFKLQAIFMAPFVLVLFLKSFYGQEKIDFKLWYFLMIPIIYIVISMPTIFLGRDPAEVLTVYLHQADTYKELNMNAANLYFLISNDYYDSVYKYGLISTIVLLFAWVIYTYRLAFEHYKEQIVISALACVSLAPMILPKMHDRYFYPADVISLIVAFYIPRLWFLPFIFQLTSFLAYSRWLGIYWHNKVFVIICILNFITVIYIIKNQKIRKSP